MKTKKPNTKAVLELADRYLSEYLEDLNNGICSDENQYKTDCRNLNDARALIKSAPELLEAGKDLQEWAKMMGGWEAKPWAKLKAAIAKTEGGK